MNLFDEIRLHQTDEHYVPLPASEPTKCRPGSLEKIRVLSLRLVAGESLWHPDDPIIDYSRKLPEFLANYLPSPKRRYSRNREQIE
jgi:hypothetical protein